jgi:hypothetical protein
LRIQEEKGFNGLVFNCIDKALKSLGESVAMSFFYQIEKNFHFPREEFVARPLEFIKCLEEFLGVAGSKIIERLIVQEIRSTFDIPTSSSNATLEGTIREAKKNFLTR